MWSVKKNSCLLRHTLLSIFINTNKDWILSAEQIVTLVIVIVLQLYYNDIPVELNLLCPRVCIIIRIYNIRGNTWTHLWYWLSSWESLRDWTWQYWSSYKAQSVVVTNGLLVENKTFFSSEFSVKWQCNYVWVLDANTNYKKENYQERQTTSQHQMGYAANQWQRHIPGGNRE